MLTKNRRRVMFLSLGALPMIGGCGVLSHQAAPHRVYNTVITAQTQPVTNINPVTAEGSGNAAYLDTVYQCLVGLSPSGHAVPGLAQSWTHNSSATVWTIHLNPYAKWWDGHPVTADDVAWTLDFYGRSQANQFRWQRMQALQNVRVISPTTVQITLFRGDPNLAANLLSPVGKVWILPSFLFKKRPMASVSQSLYLNHIKDTVGDGPFRPYKLTHQSVLWESNPHYYLGAPKAKYLRWEWNDAHPPDISNVAHHQSGYHLVKQRGTTLKVLVIQSQPAPLSLTQFQSLLNRATNRARLPGQPANSLTWSASPKVTAEPPLAPLMQQYGFHQVHGVWTDKSGQPFSVMLWRDDSATDRRLTSLLMQQWKAAGIHAQLTHDRKNADVTLSTIHALPVAPATPHNLVPLSWLTHYWQVNNHLHHVVPNVWQPFYKVEQWEMQPHH